MLMQKGEPMRLIDADALINRVVFHTDWSPDEKEAFEDEVNSEPTVEPERKAGEWIPVEDRETPYGLLMECSKCKNRIIINDALEHNYCSECGADMRSEESDEQ